MVLRALSTSEQAQSGSAWSGLRRRLRPISDGQAQAQARVLVQAQNQKRVKDKNNKWVTGEGSLLILYYQYYFILFTTQ